MWCYCRLYTPTLEVDRQPYNQDTIHRTYNPLRACHAFTWFMPVVNGLASFQSLWMKCFSVVVVLKRNMDRSRGVVRLVNPRAPERPRTQRIVGWRFGFFVSYFSAVNLSLCIGSFAKLSQTTAESAQMDISKRMLILYLACSLGPVSINISFYPVSRVISHRRKKSNEVFNTPSP